MARMLELLDNHPVGPYRLQVKRVGRQRFFDQVNFALHLANNRGSSTDVPVFRGLYNAGRPSIFVPAWIDGEFVENAQIEGERVELSAGITPNTLAEFIAERLGILIPPGGRLWIAYEAFEGDGDLARETRAALEARVPLVTTPIGLLLFRAGCWAGLRDWDIPEGGREGPRKLQGNKPINASHARQRAEEVLASLDEFGGQPRHELVEQRAQERARIVAPQLRSIVEQS